MANKVGKESKGKKSADSPEQLLQAESVRELWSSIERDQWGQFLQESLPNNHWSNTANGFKGLCPYHADKNPSFFVNVRQGFAKCFGCDTFVWNPIDFYRKVAPGEISFSDALREIKTKFNPPKFTPRITQALEELDRHQRMKDALYVVLNQELVDSVALSSTDTEYAYAKPLLAYLKHRKIPLVYEHLPIGIMPPWLSLEHKLQRYFASNGISLDLVEDAKKYVKKACEGTDWIGALVMFYGRSPGHVSRVKLRQVPGQGSVPKVGPGSTEKVVMFLADTKTPDTGVFGLAGVRAFTALLGRDGIHQFHVVEGEFDMLSIVANQIDTGVNVEYLTFAAGGQGADDLDFLKAFQLREAYIVGDNDEGGTKFVRTLLRKTKQLGVHIFLWPAKLIPSWPIGHPSHGKSNVDPAEAVEHFGFKTANEHFKRENNFLTPHAWALREAQRDIGTMRDDNVRERTNIVAQYGVLIANSIERSVFVDTAVTELKVPRRELTELISAESDQEVEFMNRIKHKLMQRLMPLFLTTESNQPVLRCWHRENSQYVALAIDDMVKLSRVIEAMEGKDLHRFIMEDVGEPGWLESYAAGHADGVYLQRRDLYRKYISVAISNMGVEAKNESNLHYISSGFHAVKPKAGTDDNFAVYLVNGSRFYKGTFPSGAAHCKWELMSGPLDGNVCVYIGRGATSPGQIHPQVRSVEDLNREPPISITALFDKVRSMIDAGWGFKNHSVACDLLAAFTLLIPICDVFDRMPMLMLTSDQSGGKTSFIGGFLGGDAAPSINVVQNSKYMASFTMPGVRQAIQFTSLLLCLDEFEDKGGNDRTSIQVRHTLTMLRGLANEEAVSTIGSVSGQAQVTRMRCPVATAGIHQLREAADTSRFAVIEMDRQINRASPIDVLSQRFGDEITFVRNNLPQCMYHYARQAYDAHKEIRLEFSRHEKNAVQEVDNTRTREMFYGIMAILRLVGRDYQQFYRDYCKAFQGLLRQQANMSISDALVDELLYSQFVEILDPTDLSSRKMANVIHIVDNGLEDVLNTKAMGVYYDKQEKWVVIHWPTMIHTFSRYTQQFKGYTAASLKNYAKRSKFHVPDDQIVKSKTLETLQKYIGNVKVDSVSVYRVHEYISKMALANTVRDATLPKGRETGDVIDLQNYKDALSQREFPKPPPPKTETPSGKSNEAKVEVASHADDPEFEY